MLTFFTVGKKKKKKKKKHACEIHKGVWKLLRISWSIDVLTGMRTELGLIKKRNLEYLQIKNQLQEEYFMVWSQRLFSEERHRRRISYHLVVYLINIEFRNI